MKKVPQTMGIVRVILMQFDPNSKYAEERETLFGKKDPGEIENYWYHLYSDTERFLADTNQDNIISLDEYRAYLLSQLDKNKEPGINQSRIEHVYSTEHTYSFDYSVIVSVAIACISSVLIAWILKKR